MIKPLRWGVVSTAQINDQVLPAFSNLAEASLVAVASRNPDRARAYAVAKQIPEWYGSYEALIESPDVDCLYISTPNSEHMEWADKALKSGKHVLCEKPLTPTSVQAEDLFKSAADHDVLLMEAFMYRHHPQTQRARQLILEGAIGDLQVIRMSFNFKTENPETDVRYRPELAGGALLDVGSYCVNFATFVIGNTPDDVGGIVRMATSGVEEGFAGQMRFGDVLVVFDCSLYTPLDIGITAVGTDGRMSVPTPWYPHQPPQQITLENSDGVQVLDCPGRNAYELEVANFTSAILGHEDPLISAAETIRNLQTLDRLADAAGLARADN